MTTNAHLLLDDARGAVDVLRNPTVHLWAWLGVLGWWLIGDAVTTIYGLSIGLSESNALLAPIVGSVGPAPALIAFKVGFLSIALGVYVPLLAFHDRAWAFGVPFGMFAVGFVATAWNSYLIWLVV